MRPCLSEIFFQVCPESVDLYKIERPHKVFWSLRPKRHLKALLPGVHVLLSNSEYLSITNAPAAAVPASRVPIGLLRLQNHSFCCRRKIYASPIHAFIATKPLSASIQTKNDKLDIGKTFLRKAFPTGFRQCSNFLEIYSESTHWKGFVIDIPAYRRFP